MREIGRKNEKIGKKNEKILLVNEKVVTKAIIEKCWFSTYK